MLENTAFSIMYLGKQIFHTSHPSLQETMVQGQQCFLCADPHPSPATGRQLLLLANAGLISHGCKATDRLAEKTMTCIDEIRPEGQ